MKDKKLLRQNLKDAYLLTRSILESGILTKKDSAQLCLMFANSLYLGASVEDYPEIDSYYNKLLDVIK